MKTKTILSAGTKQDLQNMINNYFYSKNYVITDDLKVYNPATNKTLSFIIDNKRGRWSMKKEI